MEALASLSVPTLKNIVLHCGLSSADCFEKPDLVARADMALVVLNRKKAKLALQRAARAKLIAMDSAWLARVQSALQRIETVQRRPPAATGAGLDPMSKFRRT